MGGALRRSHFRQQRPYFADRAHQIVMEGPRLRAARAQPRPGPAPHAEKRLAGGSQVWVGSRSWRDGPLRPSAFRWSAAKSAITQKGLACLADDSVRSRERDRGGCGLFRKTPGGMILKNDARWCGSSGSRRPSGWAGVTQSERAPAILELGEIDVFTTGC
jgi:hypothetical protein